LEGWAAQLRPAATALSEYAATKIQA
jgi:hypothetical protein